MTTDTTAPTRVEGVRRSVVIRHVVLSVLMWITYVVYWRVVLGRGVEAEARFAAILLALFIVLQILLTALWIAHNVWLSRRHGTRRQARRLGREPESTDFLGRRLVNYPSDGDLRRVPVIVVRVERDEKRFEAGLSFEA